MIVFHGDPLVLGEADRVEVEDELVADPRLHREPFVLDSVGPDRAAQGLLEDEDLQHDTAARLVFFAFFAGCVHGEEGVVHVHFRDKTFGCVVAAAHVAGSAIASSTPDAVVAPGSEWDVRAAVPAALLLRRLIRTRQHSRGLTLVVLQALNLLDVLGAALLLLVRHILAT